VELVCGVKMRIMEMERGGRGFTVDAEDPLLPDSAS
jgi:hypothetical protein